MSRMLKALQQIEAWLPQPPVHPESVPPETLDSQQRRPDDTPQVDQETGPDEAPRGDAAIEATLSQVEIAAGMAGSLSQEVAVPDFGETPVSSVESLSGAGSLIARWPVPPTEEHARAYGELADNILAQFPPVGRARLMFTSPGDGEGKTGTLVLLARALAERTTGQVLLVDGNLHKPAVADYLGIEAKGGLADVLAGAASWQQVVWRTEVRGLSVLPGVKSSTPDGRLPERWNLGPLLEELGGVYGLVLIDTASLAHGEVAPISHHCDGTYLVVRLKHTTRRAVAEAARVIQACRGRVLGSVVLQRQAESTAG